ncbi:MAG: GAF domain-containing protein [Sphingomonas sp.]|nr:MAG: GAF domain-containing protein [Sphingomonas sp.]
MLDAQSEAARLATLKEYGLLDTPAERAFDVIVQEAASATNAPIAMISLVDEDRQWFKAAIGVDHREDPIDESICAHAIRSDELFTVADARADARFRDIPAVARDGGIRFYAGAPLRMRNGARLGTLCVIDIAPRDDLDPEERAALEMLARRTVAAFELRRDIGDAAGLDGGDAQDWLEESADLLARAAVALDRAGASAPAAHLEHVIAMVDALRAPKG